MTRHSLSVVTESAGSGMGRFTVELANAIQAAGVDVTLVSPPQSHPVHTTTRPLTPPTPGGGRLKKLQALAKLSVDLAVYIWHRAGRRSPVLMVHLAPSLPVSLLPIVAARLRGARLALSLHDFYPHTLRFPVRLRRVERWMYRWAYRRFDLILTTTSTQTERLVREAGFPRDRVVSLYHGVFTVPDIVPPAVADETTLLVFGSLRPNKMVLESIQAVRSLRETGMAVRLRIAGAPRREDSAYWERCLAALPADGDGFDLQVRFIDEGELSEIYSGVDAFLCPYAGFDSQSGVTMTAVSNGIPVIGTAASRAAGSPLGSGWTLVDDNPDAKAIERAIRQFDQSPRLQRLADARSAQARILEAASWSRLGALYLDAMKKAGFWPSAHHTHLGQRLDRKRLGGSP